MDTGITIIQVLLAIFAASAGLVRFAIPYPRFVNLPFQSWGKDFQPWHVKVIGALEIAAAVGIILPLFVPSLAALTPLAAVGLALVMAGAMATHLRRLEYPNVAGNSVWLGLALFLAYGTLVELVV